MYFAHVILLSSDFCFSLLYLYPTVLSEHKKAFPAAQRERFWFVFCFIFFFMPIPHNSKCRYGERGAADAKPKAQIILDAAKVSAASSGNSEPKQGQRSQSARSFCPRSTMRVPQPDIIEHFGNADAVPQLPERCLSRKAGIVRCCLKHITNTGPHVILHAARCVISGYILFEAWGENQTTPWLIIALAIFSKPAMLAPATRLPFMP